MGTLDTIHISVKCERIGQRMQRAAALFSAIESSDLALEQLWRIPRRWANKRFRGPLFVQSVHLVAFSTCGRVRRLGASKIDE